MTKVFSSLGDDTSDLGRHEQVHLRAAQAARRETETEREMISFIAQNEI